jgi:hypothetical protein
MGFLVDEVVLGQGCLRVLRSSPVSMIPSPTLCDLSSWQHRQITLKIRTPYFLRVFYHRYNLTALRIMHYSWCNWKRCPQRPNVYIVSTALQYKVEHPGHDNLDRIWTLLAPECVDTAWTLVTSFQTARPHVLSHLTNISVCLRTILCQSCGRVYSDCIAKN